MDYEIINEDFDRGSRTLLVHVTTISSPAFLFEVHTWRGIIRSSADAYIRLNDDEVYVYGLIGSTEADSRTVHAAGVARLIELLEHNDEKFLGALKLRMSNYCQEI